MAHKVFNDDWITLDPSSPFEPYVHIKSTKLAVSVSDTVPPEVIMEKNERTMCDAPPPRRSVSTGSVRAITDWYDYCVPPTMQSWIRSAGKRLREVGTRVYTEMSEMLE